MKAKTEEAHNEALIDVSALAPGMTIKNYKELCNMLNQKEVTSDSKKAQLKEWKRYFDWEKQGQRFIITDVYDAPLPKAMREGSVYAKLIETLLIAYLSKQENFTYTATETELLEILRMVNPHYRKINSRETYKDMVDLYDGVWIDYGVFPVAPTSFFDFNSRVHKRQKEILYSALRSMSNRKLLVYRKEMVIVPLGKTVDDSGELEKLEPGIATIQQEKEILRVEHGVLQEMNAPNIFTLFARNQITKYYERVNEILRDKFGWDKAYRRLRLIYNQPNLSESIEETKNMLLRTASLEDIEINQKELNNTILEMLNREAVAKVEKWRTEVAKRIEGDPTMDMHINLPEEYKKSSYLNNPKYLLDQQFLAEYFIRVE